MIRLSYPPLVRFQPVGLMQSACYQKSQGGTVLLDLPRPSRQDIDRHPRVRGLVPLMPPGASETPCKVALRRPAASVVTCRAETRLVE